MKKSTLLLLLVLPFAFEGCFSTCDCAAENGNISFRILGIDTKQDLVFGPNAIYDSQQIQITGGSGIATLTRYNNFSGDSAFRVESLPSSNYILHLSTTEQVEIEIVRGEIKSGCCKGTTTIDGVRIGDKTFPRNSEEDLFRLLL